MNWWIANKYEQKIDKLRTRTQIIKSVRNFFDKDNFLEVETPILQYSPGLEPHLHAFETKIYTPDMQASRDMYLHTSPEFAMKKLLVAGLPKIYQICHVFRNAEKSPNHSAEFSMIEWYRAGVNYEKIMNDCVELLRYICKSINIDKFYFRGIEADPFKDWEFITVKDAFEKYANVTLETDLLAQIKKLDIHYSDKDSWEDLFFRIFLELIEPKLGLGAPTILYEYPISMAALSKPKEANPAYAERFELYVCGLELANAFGELTDSKIQLERFKSDMKLKQDLYGYSYPIDKDFINALEYGLPECSGIALGIDRLVMLCTNASSIDEVLWCGYP